MLNIKEIVKGLLAHLFSLLLIMFFFSSYKLVPFITTNTSWLGGLGRHTYEKQRERSTSVNFHWFPILSTHVKSNNIKVSVNVRG